ncbi:non-canonical purine NTP pyrophosphatase [Tahibacter sp.]|uniref:non-canonical purine NTP pyrophosphatase n=1 Tax=Tahibacter sp. TaxID=2056211 RepID=UPI0028C4DF0B|nr:non-canonical purine NTP pyrophosphatase [Tahibacter sp.]
MEIRFLSGNEQKILETELILGAAGAKVIAVNRKIHELQTDDARKLVEDKLVKAFKEVGREVFVEHTGLHLAGLKNFPGGLTEIFWETLQADAFADLVARLETPAVIARTTIAYCDGRRFHFFDGEINGMISKSPAGPRDFQWDCVFVPDGENRTFAEMGKEKNRHSMRRIALDKFAKFLESSR